MTGYVDGNGAAWGFTYDAMNRAVTMTDPLGNVPRTVTMRMAI